MATWLEDVTKALRNLDGIGSLEALYEEVAKLRTDLPRRYKAIIRNTIHTHSKDSEAFQHGQDVFYTVKGIGGGVWGLWEMQPRIEPEAIDKKPPAPGKILIRTYRILRDTQLVRDLKRLHKHRCQICGEAIQLLHGGSYSEGHHIQPLGSPHDGFDVPENILILCPNHHAQCDYAAIPLIMKTLLHCPGHNIGQKYLDYHNSIYEARLAAAAKTVLR